MQIVENPSLITRQPNIFPSLHTQLPQSSQLTLNFRTLCKALREQFLKTPLLPQNLPFKGLNATLMSQNEK